MTAALRNLTELLPLLLWTLCWALGGWWMARGAFRLHPREELPVGLVAGLAAEVGLANFLARVLPVPAAAWLSALLVLLLGVWLFIRAEKGKGTAPGQRLFPVGARLEETSRSNKALYASPRPGSVRAWVWRRGLDRFIHLIPQLVALALLFTLFFAISRGLAIFDDYAHLPTLSIMATGDIPPHFSFDPQVPYGYHYFLLLLAAQITRLSSWFPWTAWDAARTGSLVLAVMLGGLWARRVTRSFAVSLAAGAVLLFAGGARWLLLLLPSQTLAAVSGQVSMLGSGGQSGDDLAAALLHPWAVAGAGPLPFPYAFANGILPPGVIGFNSSTGMMPLALIFALLLTCTRWRGLPPRREAGDESPRRQAGDWPAWLVTGLVLSANGLLGESDILVFLAGWGIVTAAWLVKNRWFRLPAALRAWWWILAASLLVIAVQGGAWSDVLAGLGLRLLSGVAPVSYQTIGFELTWPPALVSSHLGVLQLTRPAQLLAALFEAGPLLLVLPLIFVWGWKGLRAGRWYEASLAAAAALSLGMLFVLYTGSTGVRNTSRLYTFMPLCLVFAVPSVWLWASRRSATLKMAAGLLGLVTVAAGVAMFGIELPAIQRPVSSYFLVDLDARMLQNYWNRLEPGGLVFDPIPSRATTLFGRFTDSSYTWYEVKPGWKALTQAPDARKLRAAGFGYAYYDQIYFDGLSLESRGALEAPCARLIAEEKGKNNAFRRLLDLRGCQ